MPVAVVVEPAQLTPAWLTAALREGGALQGGEVAGARSEQVGVGRGYASQIHRVHVNYAGDAGDLPSTFIAKLPPAVGAVRQQMAAYGLDRREVTFYRQFAGATPLPVPRCYWAALHDDGHGALLLEDLREARVLDQVQAATPTLARQALRAIAGLHARWWQQAEPQACQWLMANIERSATVVGARYAEAAPIFAERHRDWLPRAFADGLLGMAQLLADDGQRASLPHNTLQHGDFRLENLMLQGEAELRVIDFQLLRWGPGAADVAYFLGQSLEVETRRAHEQALLDDYHAALLEAGVRDYDRATLARDYRKGLLLATKVPVMFASSMLEVERAAAGQGAEARAAAEQLVPMRRLMAATTRRCVAAVMDNDALALIPETRVAGGRGL